MPVTQPDGYLALPTAGKGQAVLVLHPWWGLNNTIKAFTDRLAGEGFAAFAPDLYHGRVTNQIDEAEKLVTALDGNADQAKKEIIEAVEFLKEKSGQSTIAVIGFSMGAYYALDLSAAAPETIHSVVIFYGSGPADFSKAKAEYLGHFAGSDPYEPLENVNGLEEDLKASGRTVTFYTYPNTGHWFAESDRADAYDKAAAELAWERTVAFLKR
ncbi:MAG: dienelactone hydrolase family protein [Chloroflexi bacterium]|nr:dienelactone hydrolase family protein [Chloroflexota bacterium]MCC6891407.1 alpha/beta fold hydrolase [Anaerolineae bacterium]